MKKFIVQQSSNTHEVNAVSFELAEGGVLFHDEDGKPVAFFAAVIAVTAEEPKEES